MHKLALGLFVEIDARAMSPAIWRRGGFDDDVYSKRTIHFIFCQSTPFNPIGRD
jgi:hypothetical protein